MLTSVRVESGQDGACRVRSFTKLQRKLATMSITGLQDSYRAAYLSLPFGERGIASGKIDAGTSPGLEGVAQYLERATTIPRQPIISQIWLGSGTTSLTTADNSPPALPSPTVLVHELKVVCRV